MSNSHSVSRLQTLRASPTQRRGLLTLVSGTLGLGGVLSAFLDGPAALTATLWIAAALIAGSDIAVRAWHSLRARSASIELLVTIAAVGAIAIGEYWEAAAVTFLFLLGGYLEARTIAKTRSALSLPESTGTGFIEVPVGARIPGTARHTANLAATYRPSLGDTLNGMLRLGVTSAGSSISQIYNQDSTAPGYTTLDLKLGVEGQGWSAHAYASNLTDAKVRLFRHPNDNPETGAPQYFWGRPRTVGISVRFDLP